MQGAETSKTMIPCWRRVHFHKSTIFETMLEKIQKHHKHYAKIDPKMIENSIKKTMNNDAEKH